MWVGGGDICKGERRQGAPAGRGQLVLRYGTPQMYTHRPLRIAWGFATCLPLSVIPCPTGHPAPYPLVLSLSRRTSLRSLTSWRNVSVSHLSRSLSAVSLRLRIRPQVAAEEN